jgi:hypothetical protein
MLIVSTRIEKKRLNGYRQPGELYLVGKMAGFQCCKIPIELSDTDIPKKGIVPVPSSFIAGMCTGPIEHCVDQRMQGTTAGMMWVHDKNYPSAAHFFQECRTRPVEMHIRKLHCGIKPGESWILLAHRKAIVDYGNGGCMGWIDEHGQAHSDVIYKPGIFAMFKVEKIEFLVGDGTTNAELKKMQDAGIEIVNILHDETMDELPEIVEPDNDPSGYL